MMLSPAITFHKPVRASRAPDLFLLAGKGQLPKRYAYLDSLCRWVDAREGIGTPNVSGFYAIIGGKHKLSWGAFYRNHYEKLVTEGCLIDDIEANGAIRALVITPKAYMLVNIQRESKGEIQIVKTEFEKVPVPITVEQPNARPRSTTNIQIMHKQQKGLCWWCSKPLMDIYEVDHRMPSSRGGTDELGNLCLSCHECNHLKSDKMPWEFNGRLL